MFGGIQARTVGHDDGSAGSGEPAAAAAKHRAVSGQAENPVRHTGGLLGSERRQVMRQPVATPIHETRNGRRSGAQAVTKQIRRSFRRSKRTVIVYCPTRPQ
jgi:hypothetical protein